MTSYSTYVRSKKGTHAMKDEEANKSNTSVRNKSSTHASNAKNLCNNSRLTWRKEVAVKRKEEDCE